MPGVILGVGGDKLEPITKIGRDGGFLGYRAANEVPQTDAYSAGRGLLSASRQPLSRSFCSSG